MPFSRVRIPRMPVKRGVGSRASQRAALIVSRGTQVVQENLVMDLDSRYSVFEDIGAADPAEADDTVLAWLSQIGSISLTETTAALAPHYRVNDSAFNGQPSLEFISADSNKLRSATGNPTTGTQNRTLICCYRNLQTSNTNDAVVSLGHGASNGNLWFLTNETGLRVKGGNRIWGNDPVPNGETHVVTIRQTSANTTGLDARLDGVAITPTATGSLALNTEVSISLGCYLDDGAGTPNAASFMNCKIARILLYDTDLSDSQVAVSENVLMNLYGVS